MKNKMQWEKRNGLQRQSETKYKGKKKPFSVECGTKRNRAGYV